MAKKLPQISHNEFASVIRDKQAAEAAVKLAGKAAREARKALDLANAKLSVAMNGHTTVQCGNQLLTRVEGKPVPGALTLNDGGKVPLDTVTGVLVGLDIVRQIDARDIRIWFGGRDGGDKIEISEAV